MTLGENPKMLPIWVKLPKKLLHIGYIVAYWGHCPGNWDFLKNILVLDFLIFGLFFPLRKNPITKMPGKKVNLIIKREGLSLLETHSIRETTRILNTRYSMDLEPYLSVFHMYFQFFYLNKI